MIRFMHLLNRFFAEQNIPTDGFTLILNFKDADSGCKIEIALRRELDQFWKAGDPQEYKMMSDFEMMGIKVKVESPIHKHA